MKKLMMTTLASVSFFALQAGAAEVTYACQQTEDAQKMCDYYDARWAEITGGEHTSRRIDIPWDSNDQLALLQQAFAVKSGDLDVFMLDVVWPGLLSEHLLDLSQYGADELIKDYIPGYADNNTVDGKIIAMPMFMDTGMLYYRTDLLEKYGKSVPSTWAELKETAQYIMDEERKAGSKDMWGYVFQGKAYEGLTCDALEWVSSFGGGSVVEADGSVSINNEKAAAALDMAASFIGSITPNGVTAMGEEESRNVFQSGNAVFHRNWPYVWKLANGDDSPVKGNIAIAAVPHGGGQSASALGGWSMGANGYSKHPELAAKFLFMITDEESQRQNYKVSGNNPTITKLYDDPDFEDAKVFLPAFENAKARPSTPTGPRYNEVSNEFWNAAFSVLTNQKTGAQAVEDLGKKLETLKDDSRNWKR